MTNLNKISNFVANFESEVAILKTVVESSHSRNETFCPMIVFYNDPNTKSIVVVPQYSNDHSIMMRSIADTMHLYTALNSFCATICFTSKGIIDDSQTDLLNIFIVSDDAAFHVQAIFNIENDRIVWNDNLNYIDVNDNSNEFSEKSKDFFSMLYNYSHIENNPFSAQEILSYLSSRGAEIAQINSNILYVDFSNGNNNDEEN